MKRTYIILILFIITFSTVKINAQEDLNISKPILDKLISFGVDTEDLQIIELEPSEFKNFDDFREEDIAFQEKYITIWSTFYRGYVDILDIKAKAFSTLKGYPITNILDKKIDTAWVEGVEGDGIGEWLSLDIYTEKKKDYDPYSIVLFGIIPGYLKSDKTWEENNRIKTALLVIKTPSPGYANASESYAVIRLKMRDYKGLQIFSVSRYQRYGSDDKKIWLIIEDVYKGTKYSDTCISEIFIRGGCQPPSP